MFSFMFVIQKLFKNGISALGIKFIFYISLFLYRTKNNILNGQYN